MRVMEGFRRGKVVAVLGAVALLALVAAGCGGSGSSTAGESGAGASPSKEFLGPKEANAQAKFGQEASAAERSEVSGTVEASLQARGERDWAGQCATLSASVKKNLRKLAKKARVPIHGCAAELGALGKGAPSKVLEDNMAGPVAVFRVKGNRGYALYHGNDQKDWAMPMVKEGGEWKAASLVAEELPR